MGFTGWALRISLIWVSTHCLEKLHKRCPERIKGDGGEGEEDAKERGRSWERRCEGDGEEMGEKIK